MRMKNPKSRAGSPGLGTLCRELPLFLWQGHGYLILPEESAWPVVILPGDLGRLAPQDLSLVICKMGPGCCPALSLETGQSNKAEDREPRSGVRLNCALSLAACSHPRANSRVYAALLTPSRPVPTQRQPSASTLALALCSSSGLGSLCFSHRSFMHAHCFPGAWGWGMGLGASAPLAPPLSASPQLLLLWAALALTSTATLEKVLQGHPSSSAD